MKVFSRGSYENIKILRCAGAVAAYMIGSGFASGQEIMQFFSSYGPIYGGLGGLITLVLIVWCTKRVMLDASILELQDVNEIFTFYCGKYIGNILKWIMPLFLYCIYVIMISGAGALLEEYYNLPNAWGRMIMMVLSLITVIQGIDRITDIIGFIGPLIIVLIVAVSVLCIINNPKGIVIAGQIAETLPMKKATSYWWLSGINYATFNGLTLVPYLVGLGKSIPNKQNAAIGGMLGGGLFALTAMLLNYGILSYIELVYDKSVPTVYLADFLFKGAGIVFSLVMFAGIYTTAVPMLWTSVNKIVRDEKTLKYKVVTLALVIIAFWGGKMPFGSLVNIIYPYMGYIGIVVFAQILLEAFSQIREKK